MQALGFNQHGDINSLQLIEVEQPKPQNGEVLVKVKACALNHLDIWVREGWPGLKLSMPHICGSDAAGEIVARGEDVKKLSIGDRVALDPGINLFEDEFTFKGDHSVSPGYRIIGETLPGTFAEYIAVPARNVVRLPEHIAYEVAAATGLASMTAWRMLMHRAKLQAGQRVLVLGAGGGVNSICIQLAKLAGCKVFATTSSASKVKKTKALGADVVVNYKEDLDWSKTIYDSTDKKGVDVVIDNVGAVTLATSIRLVKRGGCIVIVGNTSGPLVDLDLRYLFTKQISLIGSTMGNHADYLHVMQMVFDGKITPPIYKKFPFKEGVEAMSVMERGEQYGKIVLTL